MSDAVTRPSGAPKKLLAELAVIVLGILLALSADAWMSDRVAAEEEREYLTALQHDPLRVPRHRHGSHRGDLRPSSRATDGIHAAREAHEWFLSLMREQEEFEVETDRVGELPMPFWSETVRQVVVE